MIYEQWPWNNFPPYVQGSAFLISGSAIHHLLSAAQVTPYLWPNGSPDDLYVGGILSEIANVTLRQSTNERYRWSIYLKLLWQFYTYIFFCFYLSLQNIRFRFGTYEDDWIPDPCFVQDHTTWMTSIPAQINASHSIIEELYRPDSNLKCQTPAPSKSLSEFNYVRFG